MAPGPFHYKVINESTVVYWRSVYAALEEYFHILLDNARHIKNVPGQKTEVIPLENWWTIFPESSDGLSFDCKFQSFDIGSDYINAIQSVYW